MSNSWREWVVAGLAAVSTAACTKTVNQCEVDTDCKNVAYPFCDVNGQYPSSGGVMNVCTIVPANCPVERCGCQPGAATCDQDQLVVCDSGGTTTTTTTCSLGCSDSKEHCLTFTPSNGLDTAFAGASVHEDVVVPDGAIFNTDSGLISVPSGSLAVSQLVVSQPKGDIRVYVAKSFALGSATITGKRAAAFVASGDITISGLVDASASGGVAPGGQTAFSDCHGTYSPTTGGGGGNNGAGGSGVYVATSTSTQVLAPGGSQQPALSALVGGCDGGGSGPGASGGGSGGGAIQLVGGGTVKFTSAGLLDVGGGGGAINSGGGAGGNIIIEAPIVDVEGGIAANGGGGGCSSAAGEDAHPSALQAKGACFTINIGSPHAGFGGTGHVVAGSGTTGMFTATTGSFAGGGAVGQLLIRTRDGMYASSSGAVLSAAISTAMLDFH